MTYTRKRLPDTEPATSRQRPEALEALVRAGLDIVAEGGAAALTIRALAHRTHYAASTIGYHVAPFDDFVDLLWRYVGSDLAEHAFRATASAEESASRIFGWAAQQPNSAAFFVRHNPRRPDRTHTGFWSFLGDIEPSASHDTATLALLHLLARRLQSALEYALDNEDGDVGRRMLASELRSMRVAWGDFGRPHQPGPS